jgi:hypothetical protein
VKVLIADTTGDFSGSKGGAGATRASHIERFGGNGSSGIDQEVLDGLVMKGPNGSELMLNMPKGKATAFVVDNTGNGLGVALSVHTTRAAHIQKILAVEETEDDQGNVTATTGPKFLLVQRTDAIAFKGPNGQEFLMYIPSINEPQWPAANPNEVDTTRYTFDKAGKKVPPDNADPNPYIVFPANGGDPFFHPTPPAAYNQGPLWWIVSAGEKKTTTNSPPPPTYLGYYIYAPTQTVTSYIQQSTNPAEPNWQVFGTTTGGYDNPLISAQHGFTAGPFTEAEALELVGAGNAWINGYNSNFGTADAVAIQEPPAGSPALQGTSQFTVASTGGAGPDNFLTIFTPLLTYAVWPTPVVLGEPPFPDGNDVPPMDPPT